MTCNESLEWIRLKQCNKPDYIYNYAACKWIQKRNTAKKKTFVMNGVYYFGYIKKLNMRFISMRQATLICYCNQASLWMCFFWFCFMRVYKHYAMMSDMALPMQNNFLFSHTIAFQWEKSLFDPRRNRYFRLTKNKHSTYYYHLGININVFFINILGEQKFENLMIRKIKWDYHLSLMYTFFQILNKWLFIFLVQNDFQSDLMV